VLAVTAPAESFAAMNASEIAAELGEARPDGGGNIKCRCPLCGKPILSLRDNPEGRQKLLINPFCGCAEPAVRQELKARHFLDAKPNGRAAAFNGGAHQAAEDAKREAKTANALDFWHANTMPLDDTAGVVYLASRLLMHHPTPASLRFTYSIYHPNERRTFPAVVALLEHEKLGPVAIHAICLNPLDPTSKLTGIDRKFSMGPVRGAAVRLFPAGPELAIGEGVETCLAFQQATGIPAWATLGGGMANFEPPLLDVVSTLILIEDQDEPGRKSVAKAAVRLTGIGHQIRVARPLTGKDINDAVLELGLDQPVCSIEDYRQISGQAGVGLEDFHAFMPMHTYIFAPSGEMWPSASVNARIQPIRAGGDQGGKPKYIAASAWLDRNRSVEQMTWAPGLPRVIADKLIIEGGWIDRPGVSCFNLYQPPTLAPGDPDKAKPWIAHVRKIYPNDANHIISWLAHRVQCPHQKINHALILSGYPGIGKDTLLEPVKRSIGPWNFREASPTQIMGRFNSFLKGVILRISEIKDLGETDRFKLYEHMKAYTAAPPDVLRCDEKHIREHPILNVCGIVYTTNYKAEGLYLPADDRRHYVAWSNFHKEDFTQEYWTELWTFLDSGGDSHVAAYLASPDLIKEFNPKTPPPLTDAFWEIVNAHRAPEDAEMLDTLESYAKGKPLDDLLTRENVDLPKAVTLRRIIPYAHADFKEWLEDRKNRRSIPHRFEACHYVPVRNDEVKDKLWKIGDRREVVYAPDELNREDQITAAKKLK
jgi:hypothetical protein